MLPPGIKHLSPSACEAKDITMTYQGDKDSSFSHLFIFFLYLGILFDLSDCIYKMFKGSKDI